ncbi:MAG: hypothetical protein ACRC2T_14260 [Thermoguttaceae bacterium]
MKPSSTEIDSEAIAPQSVLAGIKPAASQNTSVIDITFEPLSPGVEPVLPIVLKGEHIRFIGWAREYTFTVKNDILTIEGPFQDDTPNASEFYQLSQSVASRWTEVKYGLVRIRIPGRGKWGIRIDDNPNFELQSARFLAWMDELHGQKAVKKIDHELQNFTFHWSRIYSFLQFIAVSGTSLGAVAFFHNGVLANSIISLIGLCFALIFILVGLLKTRFGLYFGIICNLALLMLPIAETAIIGEHAESYGFAFPIFVPFCISPAIILIPLAMGAYGSSLIEQHRQGRLVIRR